MVKTSLLPWIGAAVIVVAGGYFFLNKSKPTSSADPKQLFYNTNTISQAVENIGSKRVIARASRNRIPKIKRARSV